MNACVMRRVLLLMLLVAVPAFAERRTGYVPPDYSARLTRSFATLSVFALPGVVIGILVARRTRDGVRHRIIRTIVAAAVIILIGSGVAAGDAMNDELWNPIFYGGFFAAAAFPASVAAAAAKDDVRRTSMIVMAIILDFPLALLISGVGPVIVLWAFEHGIPATW